ncbi:MAG: SIS domain-containing protein [Patescibacteria group bacterium]
MQHPLDNPKLIKRLDSRNVLPSVEQFSSQCRDAWREATTISLPAAYRKVSNIVLVGMGGSALGAHVVKTAIPLRIPMAIVNDYRLPDYAGKNTLVVLSSYSGTTEEVLSAAQEAQEKKAKILVIATGGALADFAKKNHAPIYRFTPLHNPCGQPRLGAGYTLIGLLAILKTLGLARISGNEVKDAIAGIDIFAEKLGPATPFTENPAKQLAKTLEKKIIFIAASEHLVGSAHIMANQINETGKQFAAYFPLPEMNHHLLEGLTFPKELKKYAHFLFLESDLYHPRTQKRYPLTQEVVRKQGFSASSWHRSTPSRISQALEAIAFSGFMTFYLSLLNDIDPSEIPWVEYFKKKMAS